MPRSCVFADGKRNDSYFTLVADVLCLPSPPFAYANRNASLKSVCECVDVATQRKKTVTNSAPMGTFRNSMPKNERSAKSAATYVSNLSSMEKAKKERKKKNEKKKINKLFFSGIANAVGHFHFESTFFLSLSHVCYTNSQPYTLLQCRFYFAQVHISLKIKTFIILLSVRRYKSDTYPRNRIKNKFSNVHWNLERKRKTGAFVFGIYFMHSFHHFCNRCVNGIA